MLQRGGIAINEEKFPDEVFRTYVKNNFDKNKDNILSQSECDDAKEIDLFVDTVSDARPKTKSLKGIEYFKKLTSLNCSNNQLTNLDVSQNIALTSLDCSFNKQITNLDVSKNIALTSLDCSQTNLTSLDVSQNKKLYKLLLMYDKITSLDLSKNTHLDLLYVGYNPLISLKLHKPKSDFFYADWGPSSHTVTMEPGISKIPFTVLPQGFDKSKIEGEVTGASLENDGFHWDGKSEIIFLYHLTENTSDEWIDVHLTVLLAEVVGPKDPTKPDGKNPDKNKYWTVTFKSADTAKGTVDAKNTFYVLKTAKKTLADLEKVAPATTAKDGFKFDKWDPALNAAKAIDKDMTVKANFVALDGVVGPKNPTKPEGKNPDPSKYWTVKFESADTAKGTVATENTFYVLKTAKKTLADLQKVAPATTAKDGFKFDKWDPALDKNTVIDKDMTVKAYFKQKYTPTPSPAPVPAPELVPDNNKPIPAPDNKPNDAKPAPESANAESTSIPNDTKPQVANAKAIPQTGDATSATLYTALMGLPGVSLLAAGLRRRKHAH